MVKTYMRCLSAKERHISTRAKANGPNSFMGARFESTLVGFKEQKQNHQSGPPKDKPYGSEGGHSDPSRNPGEVSGGHAPHEIPDPEIIQAEQRHMSHVRHGSLMSNLML